MSDMDFRETGTERTDLPHEPEMHFRAEGCVACGRDLDDPIHETGDAPPQEKAAATVHRELGS